MASLLKRSAVTLIFQLGSQAISVLTGVVLARSLGPAGKGVTAYAVVALAMVTTFFGGQNQAIAFQFGQKRLSLQAVHRAMFVIFAVTTPLCMAAMIAIGWYYPSQVALIAAAAALPFALYAQFSTQFFIIIGRQAVGNMQSLGSTVFFGLVVTPLLFFGHAGTTVALIVWIASNIVGAIYSAVNILPYLQGKRPYERDAVPDEEPPPPTAPPTHAEVLREHISFSWKSGLGSLASFLNLRIDVFIVSVMLGAGELGIYTLAIATGELIWKVAQAVIWSALARIASETPERSALLVAKVSRNLFTFQFACAVVIYIVAPPLIKLVYGQAFAEAATALRYLLPGLSCYTVDAVIAYFFSVQKGRPLLRLVVQGSSIVICAVITLLTIHRLSIIGAAIATSVSYISVVIFMSVLFARTTGLEIRSLFLLERSDIDRYIAICRSILRRPTSA